MPARPPRPWRRHRARTRRLREDWTASPSNSLSTTETACPSASSRRQRCVPMKPAPPVTSTLIPRPSFPAPFRCGVIVRCPLPRRKIPKDQCGSSTAIGGRACPRRWEASSLTAECSMNGRAPRVSCATAHPRLVEGVSANTLSTQAPMLSIAGLLGRPDADWQAVAETGSAQRSLQASSRSVAIAMALRSRCRASQSCARRLERRPRTNPLSRARERYAFRKGKWMLAGSHPPLAGKMHVRATFQQCEGPGHVHRRFMAPPTSFLHW